MLCLKGHVKKQHVVRTLTSFCHQNISYRLHSFAESYFLIVDCWHKNPSSVLEISEEKGKKRGEGLASSSISENNIYNPRSCPRPRKTEDKDLGPRLALVKRPLENLFHWIAVLLFERYSYTRFQSRRQKFKSCALYAPNLIQGNQIRKAQQSKNFYFLEIHFQHFFYNVSHYQCYTKQ